jgi:hypothetical protein
MWKPAEEFCSASLRRITFIGNAAIKLQAEDVFAK